MIGMTTSIQNFTDPRAALAHVTALYDAQIGLLREALQRFVAGETFTHRVRARYPQVRVHSDTVARADSRLAYGFVAGAGAYETSLTRPDLFGNYYLEQFRLLLKNHGAHLVGGLEVGLSEQPIAVHFSLAEHDYLEGSMSAERRLLMRDLFDLPDLGAMDDGIANGTHEPRPGEAQPLSLFTAPRVDYSLHRLRHYTGTAPEHFQNFVLFTNYQFYIDEFVRLGQELMAQHDTDYVAFVEPGNVVTRRAGLAPEAGDELGAIPPRMPQMPAYHLLRDNRNWELLPQRTPERRFSQSRAVALDMESATIAANGFRFRVPYGTLLCVSDKPLHGEIKLPGMANQFYRERVNQHLRIGLRAVELLRQERPGRLHSRKLRSFAEVAFQ